MGKDDKDNNKKEKKEKEKKEPWTVYILKMQADQSSTILNHCKLDRSQTYALIFFILPRFIAFLSTPVNCKKMYYTGDILTPHPLPKIGQQFHDFSSDTGQWPKYE